MAQAAEASPMRRLFLHVGPPKTGTTAVQQLLLNRPELGVIYPRVGLWADGAHHNLAFNFFGDAARPELVRADSGAQLDEVAALTEGHGQDLLISSESLVSQDVGALIRALLERLGGGWEAEILFTCREHYDWAASLYNQSVKDPAMRERHPPGAYLCDAPHRFCLMPMIGRMAASGFPLRVLNYHPAADFVPRFLAAIGLEMPAEQPVERRNISLGMAGLVAMLATNQVVERQEEAQAFFQALRGMKGLFASAPMIFEPGDMARAAPVLEEDRARLEAAYGVRLPLVDFAERENRFFVSAAEFEQIAARFRSLGDQAEAVIAALGQHVRPPRR
jgi:hypothetical protein